MRMRAYSWRAAVGNTSYSAILFWMVVSFYFFTFFSQIQPLRASNQPVDKMMKIVLLGDEMFLAREVKRNREGIRSVLRISLISGYSFNS